MDIISILLVIAATVSAGFGVVLLRDRQDRVRLGYAVNILAIMWWVSSMYFYRTASPEHLLFFTKMLYVAASTIASTFFYFTYLFPKPEAFNPWKRLAAVFIPNLLLAVLVAGTSLVICGASIRTGLENFISFGMLYPLYVAYILFYFLYGFVRLFGKYRATPDKAERMQIVYLLFGYALGANISFITNLLAPWFGYFALNWAGQLTSILMVSFAVYAIVRHHLFNARIIATELLTFFVWIFLLARTLLAQTFFDQVVDGTVFAATLIVGIFLIRSVIQEVRIREKVERLAEDLKSANDRLRELDQQKSEFVSIASHQLRGPLTAIKGYASLILDGSYGAVPAAIHKPVDNILESAEALVLTVEDFLDVSRIEQGRMKYDMQPLDMAVLAGKVIEELRPNIEKKGLAISLVAPAGSPCMVSVDSGKLKQVVVNLVDNSVKYTPAGSITLSVSRREGAVRLSVSDTGVGIPTGALSKLFEKFERASNANSVNVTGTGLGLYVAKEIVKAHNGKIWAESEGEGKGASFIVELPRIETPSKTV
jgi:signal transduction histidine kinase